MSLRRVVRPYYNLIKREKSVSTSSELRSRSLYKYFLDIQTRWRDNDVYGHVNNTVYGEWIDTIVNKYLIEECSLEPSTSPLIGFVVSSHCEYYSPISYPSKISAGLFVNRIGKSSVDYCVGIFENGKEAPASASAVGGFTHVFVSRINRRSHSITDEIKTKLLSISNKIQ